jgi:hypothetical protein
MLGPTIALGPFLRLSAVPYSQMPVLMSALQSSDRLHFGLFVRDFPMLCYGFRLLSIGLQFSYTDLRTFYPGIHLGYYLSLVGLCPGFVDIYLGDESTSL